MPGRGVVAQKPALARHFALEVTFGACLRRHRGLPPAAALGGGGLCLVGVAVTRRG